MNNFVKLKSRVSSDFKTASKYAKKVAVNTVKREMVRAKKAGRNQSPFGKLDF